MSFDYAIYLFILISFIYGMYRGIKRQISYFIVFSISVFVPLYLYDVIKALVGSFIDLNDIFSKIKPFTDFVNMSYGYFEFLICYIVPFMLINLIFNGLLYALIFRRNSVKRKEIKVSHRLFGGLLGILVGLELSIVMLLLLNGVVSFDTTGMITSLLQNLSGLKELLSQVAQAIGEVA